MRKAQLWNRCRQTRPETCGRAVTPIPNHLSRFLDLLLDLRTKMYHFMPHRPLQIDADEAGPIETAIHRRR